MPKLCLNAIVKNEAARIERMLKSVAPYIDCAVIYDTGSTDNTVEIMSKFFKGCSIPFFVVFGHFTNFEQARNGALAAARGADLDWDYLLLCDADMELVVEDKDFKKQLAGGLAYNAVQRAGTLSYHNARFMSRKATGNYMGVTHEYLDVQSQGEITGIFFTDYADGSNRKDKFIRDIALLLPELEKDPKNARYWFYLAQSYRDAGEPQKAAEAYRKRIELGGWDEEVWNARCNLAHSLRDMGDDAGFVREQIAAYNFRPSRAEALYDLAKYYREKGMNHACLMVAEEGMRIPRPNDLLFVNDYVYSTGLKEEFAICAYYDETRRQRGFEMCNKIGLDAVGNGWSREQARGNLFHYVKPLCEHLTTFGTRRIGFAPPDGYTAMNPSVAVANGQICVLLRAVNYLMDEQGRYLIKGTNGEANSTNPINTRNFLLQLRDNFEVEKSVEITAYLPKPTFDLVTGFEDMRLFSYMGAWQINACVREQNREGWCEQWKARIDLSEPGKAVLWGAHAMLPEKRQHEKNWMPWVDGDNLEFVYRLGVTVDQTGKVASTAPTGLSTDQISGGSQVIPFKTGWLAVVHEARVRPDTGKRYYQHRFVWYDNQHQFRKLTLPFFFHDKVIEFVAGIAWHPDEKRIMISYGREDKEAWIATVDANDLEDFIWHG